MNGNLESWMDPEKWTDAWCPLPKKHGPHPDFELHINSCRGIYDLHLTMIQLIIYIYINLQSLIISIYESSSLLVKHSYRNLLVMNY